MKLFPPSLSIHLSLSLSLYPYLSPPYSRYLSPTQDREKLGKRLLVAAAADAVSASEWNFASHSLFLGSTLFVCSVDDVGYLLLRRPPVLHLYRLIFFFSISTPNGKIIQ